MCEGSPLASPEVSSTISRVDPREPVAPPAEVEAPVVAGAPDDPDEDFLWSLDLRRRLELLLEQNQIFCDRKRN